MSTTWSKPEAEATGDPLRRDPEAVREDVRQGKVSLEKARTEYGVVLQPAGQESGSRSQQRTSGPFEPFPGPVVSGASDRGGLFRPRILSNSIREPAVTSVWRRAIRRPPGESPRWWASGGKRRRGPREPRDPA